MATLLDLFAELRTEARIADSREELVELHRRAGYLVRLSRTITSPSLGPSSGVVTPIRPDFSLAGVAEREFARTADTLNRRGRAVGLSLDLPAQWAPELV